MQGDIPAKTKCVPAKLHAESHSAQYYSLLDCQNIYFADSAQC